MPSMIGLAILVLLAVPATRGADGPPSKDAMRIIGGRVTDSQGRPARGGKVTFGPQAPPAPFTEAATATIDDDGHYRVELADFPPLGQTPLPAAGPLRYLVLAPGFRASVGSVAAGPGPTVLDIRLEAEPWKTTDLLLADREGKLVANAEVAVTVAGYLPWARLASNPEGRCQIAMAVGQPLGASIRREGYLPVILSLPNNDNQPSEIRIGLREPIRGRVVDPQGRPLPGIQIGQGIGPDFFGSGGPRSQERRILRPPNGMTQPATSDREGRFVLTPTVRVSALMPDPNGELRNLPQIFCFTDEGFRRFSFLGVDFKNPISDQEIVLKPGRLIRVPIEHEVATPSGNLVTGWSLRIVPAPEKPNASLSVMGGLLPAQEPGGSPKLEERIEVYLPVGKHRLLVTQNDPRRSSSQAIESAEVELTIPPGEGPLDLPPIRLTAPADQRLIGKPAPEIEATDLDTGRPVKLADFLGKVVVLDFWGYWCGPCVIRMPALAEVHKRFNGQPVVILGLHDQSVQSREEYDRKLAGVKHQLWADRDLPFRVALDRPDPERDKDRTPEATGLTCKRYEIKYFPTLLVIDQQGMVVGTVPSYDHERLEAMIKGLLEKVPRL